MEQETSILRYTELTAILHSTSKKELTEKVYLTKISISELRGIKYLVLEV